VHHEFTVDHANIYIFFNISCAKKGRLSIA